MADELNHNDKPTSLPRRWVDKADGTVAERVDVVGTVTTTPSGTQNTNLVQVAGTAVTESNGVAAAGTQRIALASNNSAITNFGHRAEDVPHTTGDSGVFVLGVRNDTAASQTSADGDYGAISVDRTGSVITIPKAATGTQTSVANSTASFTVLAANAARRGATIFNDDAAVTLKIKFGATASTTSFVTIIAALGYYEVPFGYTGIIDGIASAATGNARVTELT